MNLKLKDIVRELEVRGRHEEAKYYKIVVPFDLGLLHDIDEEEILEMTVDEIDILYRLPPKPARYSGWSFWWGSAALDAKDNSAGNC